MYENIHNPELYAQTVIRMMDMYEDEVKEQPQRKKYYASAGSPFAQNARKRAALLNIYNSLRYVLYTLKQITRFHRITFPSHINTYYKKGNANDHTWHTLSDVPFNIMDINLGLIPMIHDIRAFAFDMQKTLANRPGKAQNRKLNTMFGSWMGTAPRRVLSKQ